MNSLKQRISLTLNTITINHLIFDIPSRRSKLIRLTGEKLKTRKLFTIIAVMVDYQRRYYHQRPGTDIISINIGILLRRIASVDGISKNTFCGRFSTTLSPLARYWLQKFDLSTGARGNRQLPATIHAVLGSAIHQLETSCRRLCKVQTTKLHTCKFAVDNENRTFQGNQTEFLNLRLFDRWGSWVGKHVIDTYFSFSITTPTHKSLLCYPTYLTLPLNIVFTIRSRFLSRSLT